MRNLFLLFLFTIFTTLLFSQEIKNIQANYTSIRPRIDGILDDSIWQNTAWVTDFVQYEPFNNEKPSQKTFVKLAFDNYAVYIAADCRVDSAGRVYSVFSERDNLGQADYFGFYLDTYNNGITGFGFFVTAAGVQVDMKIDNNSENTNWDAVWFSKVVDYDSGFVVEMKIPYSAFRFPRRDLQNWRINFYRNIQQNREICTWNYVDNLKSGILNQLGYVSGIENIKPPLRLSFMPYVSTYLQRRTISRAFGRSFNGGLDLKYGINQSFTIDMMLIPDFNQVETDDEVLNLSPYETYYDEKRYFFTEGTDIFNKGGIFYSRRIGKQPTEYKNVDELLHEDEIIYENPSLTQILNATKFSGKTNKGLGIGVLNAFTGSVFAEVYDTITDTKRKILTEPFCNYNIIALNQPLKNNSYISLTNTNFSSFGRNYTSFVTAEEGNFRNKNNSWSIFERLAVSQIFDDTIKANRGFAYNIAVSKTSGNFRVSISQRTYSKDYNPNDLGYLKQNNISTNSLSLSYNIYKPFSVFLQWRNLFSVNYQVLFEDNKYIGTDFYLNSALKFRNNQQIGVILNLTPDVKYDYFEPRVEDQFFVRYPIQHFLLWTSSNYAKVFAYDIQWSYYLSKFEKDYQNGMGLLLSPRVRLSDKALLVYSVDWLFEYNDYGYVGKSVLDTVFFGRRDTRNITNDIKLQYNFTNKIMSALKIRHYWSIVDYYNFYTLDKDGKLMKLNYSYRYIDNIDMNYNIFTIDLIFKWIFLPGSEFAIVYKKQIISNKNNLIYDFYDNFEDMYFYNSHLNSISFKLIYYLDSNSMRRMRH